MQSKQTVYDEVTQRIIAALEAGTPPWVMPWSKQEAGKYGTTTLEDIWPVNASTKRPYSGVNVFLLWLMGPKDGGPPAYMTYKQAEGLGANVMRGAKGFRVVYADSYVKKVQDSETGEERDEKRGFLKRHTVFHVSQIENLPARFYEERPKLEYGALADSTFNAWVAATGAIVKPGGTQAAYYPSRDIIGMPPLQAFRSDSDYKATLLHELVHWSGHRDRLARINLGMPRMSHAYAQEELVAEMGAAFLCARLGVTGQLQHPEYLAHWLKVLKEDNRAIFRAAAAAQKAADYLCERVRQPVQRGRALVPLAA